jgi:putative ABC transport system ATP-binding protein
MRAAQRLHRTLQGGHRGGAGASINAAPPSGKAIVSMSAAAESCIRFALDLAQAQRPACLALDAAQAGEAAPADTGDDGATVRLALPSPMPIHTEPAVGDVVFVARHLSKVYRTGEVEVVALRDVSLDIGRGEFVVLLGASGSGKSTLLNILGGLDVPSSGEVRFGDHALSGASEAELTRYRREHVGFVFQFYNLIPSLTVLENVALVTDIAPQSMRADEAIALVGLAPRRDHFPAQLSGGEQQRVAIARAIVKRPDVLLCDEPTGALDYQTGKLVLEVIAQINRDLGTTAVVITHNAAIAGMADRVVHLGDGQVQRIERNAKKLSPSELSW